MTPDGRPIRDGVVVPPRRRHMRAEQGLEQGGNGRVQGFAEEWANICCHKVS